MSMYFSSTKMQAFHLVTLLVVTCNVLNEATSVHHQCEGYPYDIRILISGHECHNAIDNIGSHVCYEHWFRTRRCCERCMQIKNATDVGCEYGDWSDSCATIKAKQCYNGRNEHICCATCRRFRNKAQPDCMYGDMASCHKIPRGMCVIPANRRICCQTCPRHRDDDNPTCAYGDQSSTCYQIRAIDCYSPRTERICCSSCARLKLQQPNCPYGDRSTQCRNIRSGDCYDTAMRTSCCQTCDRHRTNVQGCEYGDSTVLLMTAVGSLNCEAYIRIYTTSRCRDDLSVKCCHSCRAGL